VSVTIPTNAQTTKWDTQLVAGTTLTFTVPSGVATGNHLMIVLHGDDNDITWATPSTTAGCTAWTKHFEENGSSGDDSSLAMFWCYVTDALQADGESVAVVRGGNEEQVGVLAVISDAHEDFIDVAYTAGHFSESDNTDTPSIPTIITNTDGALVIALDGARTECGTIHTEVGGATWLVRGSSPAGFLYEGGDPTLLPPGERQTNADAGPSRASMGSGNGDANLTWGYYEKASAGIVGSYSVNLYGWNRDHKTVVFAIKPAPTVAIHDGAAVLLGTGAVAATGELEPPAGAAALAGVGTLTAAGVAIKATFSHDFEGEADETAITESTSGPDTFSNVWIGPDAEAVYDTGRAKEGDASGRVSTGATLTTVNLNQEVPSNVDGDLFTSIYLWRSASTLANSYRLGLSDSAGTRIIFVIRIQADDTWDIIQTLPSWTIVGASVGTLPTDEWVRLDVYGRGGNGDGIVTARIFHGADLEKVSSTVNATEELGGTGLVVDYVLDGSIAGIMTGVADAPAIWLDDFRTSSIDWPLPTGEGGVHEGAAVLAGVGTVAAVGQLVPPTGAAVLTGAGTLAATGVLVPPTGAAALSGTGTVAATGRAVYADVAALTGSGAVTAAGILVPPTGAATLAGSGTLSAAGVPLHDGAGSLVGVGTLAATADALKVDGAAALSGVGTVAAAGILVPPEGAAALAGSGALTAAGVLVPPTGAAVLAGAGTLTATADALQIEGAAVLVGAGAVTAAGGLVTPGAAILAGVGNLQALATAVHLAASALTGSGTVAAVGELEPPSGSATLAGVGTLSADAEGSIAGAAVLAGSGTVAAAGVLIPPAGTAVLSGAGALTATGALAPIESAATLNGTGTVTATGALAPPEGTATLAGTGAVVAAGQLDPPEGAALLVGVGTLAAAAEGAVYGEAVLVGSGTTTTSGLVLHSTAADLGGLGTAEATGQSLYGAVASLSGQGTVTSAAGATAYTGSGILAGQGLVTVAGARLIIGAANLDGIGTLTASSTSFYWQPDPASYSDDDRYWTPNTAGYEPQVREGA